MSIVLPIVIAAVVMGLFAERITVRHWLVLSMWILLVIIYNYVKHT